jgi:alpha-D-xyloside xylohydrolase
MISVWPRFVPESRYYETVYRNGWFEQLADGSPTTGLPYDRAGADIDTTNPDAVKWYWDIIRENYVDKGFDAFWADVDGTRSSPRMAVTSTSDLGRSSSTSIRSSITAAFYNGMRHDMKERAVILARDSYIGAQHNGTIFWSSDISANWDTLKRQVPTGINFVASGMPYWSTDIGGWQSPAYNSVRAKTK